MASHIRRLHKYTYDAYLEHEASSNVKHEFLEGEIFAMAGGTVEHAVLAVNVSASLRSQLRDKGCIVASSDLKVRVAPTGLVTYPDVTVVCGPVERDTKSRDVVLNPAVVVEVLSDSTEDWDRGEKLDHYRQIESLRACILVSHRARRIEVFARGTGNDWALQAAGPGQDLAVPGIDARLAVDDIYSDVDVKG